MGIITTAGLRSDCFPDTAFYPLCLHLRDSHFLLLRWFIFFSNLNPSVHKLLFHPELKKKKKSSNFRGGGGGQNKMKRKAVQITQEDFKTPLL